MKNAAHGIIRWLPLVVATAACSADLTTAPQSLDSSLLVSSQAGKKTGFETSNLREPYRYEQLWADGQGNTKVCQLNSYEDLDGNDFVSFGPDGSYRKEQVNERDGFVMIIQNGQITHIGRSTWNGELWFNQPYGYPVYDPSVEYQISVNSFAQGVTFPLAAVAPGDPDLADLLYWLGKSDPVPGAWDDQGNPLPIRQRIDLLNDPLGIVENAPAGIPGVTNGEEARAVKAINTLLARYSDHLVGVECDADYSMALPEEFDQIDYNGDGVIRNVFTIRHNEILLGKTWPKELKRFF